MTYVISREMKMLRVTARELPITEAAADYGSPRCRKEKRCLLMTFAELTCLPLTIANLIE